MTNEWKVIAIIFIILFILLSVGLVITLYNFGSFIYDNDKIMEMNEMLYDHCIESYDILYEDYEELYEELINC